MAVGQDRLGTDAPGDPSSGSTERSRPPFWRRLLLWAFVSAVVLLGLRVALPVSDSPPNGAFLAFDLAFCCCAALGAAIYSFATFVISRVPRDLLASAGFFALSGAAALQAMVDLSGLAPSPHERMMTSGVLYASCTFCAASLMNRGWFPESRAGAWAQLGVGWIVAAAFPLVMLPDVIAGIGFNQFDTTVVARSPAYGLQSRLMLVAAALAIGAVAGNYRRYRTDTEGSASIECYFYVALAFAAFARSMSATRFDAWWVCGQMLFLESWLVFLCAGGVENAITHRDGRDRLEEMEALHEISWSLVGAGTVRELVSVLANTVREKLGASIVAIYLADETRETLEVAAIAGPDICLRSLGAKYKAISSDRRPGFHSGHSARAFTTKEVQVAADVFVDVELVPWRIVARDDGCAASLPLVDKGEAAGVLNVYFSDHRLLSRQRLRLLITIAAAATPAIENARSTQVFRAGLRELDRAA